MSIEVAELETLRADLIRARARGVREVQTGNERVRYGSDAEMASAIAELDARLRRTSGARPSAVKFSSSKGF